MGVLLAEWKGEPWTPAEGVEEAVVVATDLARSGVSRQHPGARPPPAMQSFGNRGGEGHAGRDGRGACRPVPPPSTERAAARARDDDADDARLEPGVADERLGKKSGPEAGPGPCIRRFCMRSWPEGVKGDWPSDWLAISSSLLSLPSSSLEGCDRLLGVHCPVELPVDVRDRSGVVATSDARTWGDESGEFSSSESPSESPATIRGTVHGGRTPPSPWSWK